MATSKKLPNPQFGLLVEDESRGHKLVVMSDHRGDLWQIDVVAATVRPVTFEKAAKAKRPKRKKR